MKLSHLVKELELIRERKGDIDIKQILSEDYFDEINVVLYDGKETLQFYKLPF